MTLTQPHRSDRAAYSHIHKTKEPKFVPYEPYKAAITPLVLGGRKKNRAQVHSRSVISSPNWGRFFVAVFAEKFLGKP
jgi:hypothetical protein